MAKWIYTLESGSDLREAIENDDLEQTAKCILKCLRELTHKLLEAGDPIKDFDIEALDDLVTEDIDSGDFDEDRLNEYLNDLYDICDNYRAWIGGI